MNYYIADTHFGHANAIRHDSRPFGSVQEMEAVLTANWNAVVRPGDTVYIVGDFVWGKADEWLRIVKRLRGKKVLIRGNHDIQEMPEKLREQFVDVVDYLEVADNSRNNESRVVILSHYPIIFYKRSHNPKYYMLCGHVHQTMENDYLQKWTQELRAAHNGVVAANCGQIYNVGCMMPWMNYTPRTLDEILKAIGEV